MKEDEKTRLVRHPAAETPISAPLPADTEETRSIKHSDEDSGTRPTRLVDAQLDEDKTVVLGPPTRTRSARQVPATDPMVDPVVGWLVIVSGPGQGSFVRLGYGMNSIGRAEDQRCRLDFGDTDISRKSHATLSYDPRGRKFYLQHGGGQNLTYLGETPVLQPSILEGGELISLGKTVLKFVPLCGADFDWAQDEK